jgi:chromosomal replication initiation ATPase DnaA
MNRQRFISDFRRLARQFSSDLLPEMLADYVEQIPRNKDHATSLNTVDKDVIINLCCQHFKVSLMDMILYCRKESVRYKRQVTIYLLDTRTRMNQTEIAEMFHRDRTTVASTKKRVQDLMDTDMGVREEIAYLNAQL